MQRGRVQLAYREMSAYFIVSYLSLLQQRSARRGARLLRPLWRRRPAVPLELEGVAPRHLVGRGAGAAILGCCPLLPPPLPVARGHPQPGSQFNRHYELWA